MYGRRRYGRLKQDAPKDISPTALPTYVCGRCKKVRQLTVHTLTLNGVVNNAVSLTQRICEECSKLLKEWMNGK